MLQLNANKRKFDELSFSETFRKNVSSLIFSSYIWSILIDWVQLSRIQRNGLVYEFGGTWWEKQYFKGVGMAFLSARNTKDSLKPSRPSPINPLLRAIQGASRLPYQVTRRCLSEVSTFLLGPTEIMILKPKCQL